MAGGKGKNTAYFGRVLGGRGKLITACRQDSTVTYTTATRALMGGILNLSEIWPVYLVDRLYLSVAVTYRRQMLHIRSVSGVVEN